MARSLAEAARQTALADGDLPALALANEHLAWYCLMQSRLEDGLRYATVAVSHWAELHDRAHEAVCRGYLAWLMCEAGDEDAITEAQRAVMMAEQASDAAALALVQNALCVVLWMLQQHDLASRAGLKAVVLARQVEDPLAVGRWLLNAALPEGGLAELAAASGDVAAERLHYGRSIDMTREAVAVCAGCGDTWAACIASCNLVESLIQVGRLAEARAALERAQGFSGEVTASRRNSILHMSGLLASAEGRTGDALSLLQYTLDTAVASNDLCIAEQVAKALSASLESCGRFHEALKVHQQYFALYLRRSAEKSQLRARMLSEQHELRELQYRAAKFEQLAGEDALTKLPNRRQLDLILRDYSKQGRSFGIAFIDVDHFKAINDALTHLVGDKVLSAIGSLLASITREGDCIGRFGGEEFLLIAPAASSPDGAMLCERLRAVVAEANWMAIDARLRVTVSIGYSFFQQGADLAEMMKLADIRMYKAKKSGRNRVVLDDDFLV